MRPVEDCFDDSFIKEVEVDAPVDEALVRRMAEGGRLELHRDFPRPYFQIKREGAFIIQGVLGNRTFRVTFSRHGQDKAETELRKQIEQ